jgi:hypothetical protein
MGDVISLRKARKNAQRDDSEKRAAQNRLLHGRTKAARTLDAARNAKATRALDLSRIDTGETSDEIAGC